MRYRAAFGVRLTAGLAMAILALGAARGGAAAEVESRDVVIWSEGARLAGNVFRPAGLAEDETVPGILLVHGWGGLKSHLNNAYAPQFAERGFIVVTFDYRGWGESEGWLVPVEPMLGAEGETEARVKVVREVVDPMDQLLNIRAALDFLAGEPNVAADNLGIWGSSLGGGLSVVTAVHDPRIKAIVTQVGSLDFANEMRAIDRGDLADLAMARARGDLDPMPGEAEGAPGLRGYAHTVKMIRYYDPRAYWDRISVPTLIIDADEEELFDRRNHGGALYEVLKDKVETEYLLIPGTHYEVYRGEGYRQALAAQQAWFVEHLK